MKHFKVQDPFNNNEVEGYIFHKTARYGDLQIDKVNGKWAKQYIKHSVVYA